MPQPIEQSNFRDWQNHPVTKELMLALNVRMDEAMQEIVESGDPEYDRLLKGMIHAFREVNSWEPENLIMENDRNDELPKGNAG